MDHILYTSARDCLQEIADRYSVDLRIAEVEPSVHATVAVDPQGETARVSMFFHIPNDALVGMFDIFRRLPAVSVQHVDYDHGSLLYARLVVEVVLPMRELVLSETTALRRIVRSALLDPLGDAEVEGPIKVTIADDLDGDSYSVSAYAITQRFSNACITAQRP